MFDVLADRRVADVGQVRHLAAVADVAVLDLDVGADVHAVGERGARPQIGERPDRDVGADAAAPRDGALDPAAAHRRRCRSAWSAGRSRRPRRRAWCRAGRRPAATSRPARGSTSRRPRWSAGSTTRHAGAHVRVEQPRVVDAVGRGELDAVVDAGGLVAGAATRPDPMAAGGEDRRRRRAGTPRPGRCRWTAASTASRSSAWSKA